jgi:death-on-curing family protein
VAEPETDDNDKGDLDANEGVAFISEKIIFELQAIEVTKFDGGLPGVRDENCIVSALNHPQHLWYYGLDDYEEDLETAEDLIFLLAADYLYRLATQQGFIDGNKRTALATALYFLELNGLYDSGSRPFKDHAAQKEIEDFVKEVANDRVSFLPHIAGFLKYHFAL